MSFLFREKKDEIKTITDIPFDLRYLPDLIFYTPSKVASIFPNEVGNGNLMLRPCAWTNFTELCLIIDDYVVQFSSTAYMYILDIVKNDCYRVNLANIDSEVFQTWVLQVSEAARGMNQAYKENSDALRYLKGFTNLMFYYISDNINRDVYENCLYGIKGAFGVALNDNKMEIRNRAWYYNNKKQTWGHVAHCIFRDYFKTFINF